MHGTTVAGQFKFVHDSWIRSWRWDVLTSPENRKIQVCKSAFELCCMCFLCTHKTLSKLTFLLCLVLWLDWTLKRVLYKISHFPNVSSAWDFWFEELRYWNHFKYCTPHKGLFSIRFSERYIKEIFSMVEMKLILFFFQRGPFSILCSPNSAGIWVSPLFGSHLQRLKTRELTSRQSGIPQGIERI